MKKEYIVYLLIMAGVTYLIRMLPLVLVRRKLQNAFVLSFLHYLPYTVLAVMTFPAVFYATSSVWSALAGVIVAFVLALFGRGLFTVALFSCISVYLTELIIL